MERGYIKLWRSIWDNDYWPQDRAYTKLEAWLDLLMLATYRDAKFEKRGAWVEIKRGQVGRSIKGLANRWKWSVGKVDRFLQEKASGNDPQIEYQKSNLTTLITIINYDKYQGDGNQMLPQTETRRKPDGNQTETYNKDKKLKKDKNKDLRAEIILDLNSVTGKSFKPDTAETVKLLNGRISEGYALEDFKRVHRLKYSEWGNEPEREEFLRPKTLYRPSNFESYVNKRTSGDIVESEQKEQRKKEILAAISKAQSDIKERQGLLVGMPEDHPRYKEHNDIIKKATAFIARKEKEIGGLV